VVFLAATFLGAAVFGAAGALTFFSVVAAFLGAAVVLVVVVGVLAMRDPRLGDGFILETLFHKEKHFLRNDAFCFFGVSLFFRFKIVNIPRRN
jgi:hypothetical protein